MSVPPPRYLLAATVLMLMTFPLHAATILPQTGGIVSPVEGRPVPSNIDSFLIDETESDFFLAPGPATPFISGVIDEAVVNDNAFGLSCAGCLDFAFQISVDPSSAFSIYQAVLANFSGFTVNVGYGTGTGTIIPDSGTRGPAGGAVGFTFGSVTGPTLGPDEDTVFMLIATNATKYDSAGVMNLGASNLDGEGTCTPFDVNHCRNGQVQGLFEPTAAPEPSSALLLGLGLAGIAAFRKRLV